MSSLRLWSEMQYSRREGRKKLSEDLPIPAVLSLDGLTPSCLGMSIVRAQ